MHSATASTEVTRKPAKAPGLPLRYRVPNPPVGIEVLDADVAALREAFERYPVSVLVGEASSGKTMLLRATLTGPSPLRLKHVIYVRAREGQGAVEVCSEVLRALATLDAPMQIDWSLVGQRLEDLLVLMLDVAEALDAFVVIDEAHLMSAEAVVGLANDLGSYARASRWALVTRELQASIPNAHVIQHRGATKNVADTVIADTSEVARIAAVVRSGDLHELERWLSEHGASLIADGYAPELARALLGQSSPVALRWQLRCAVETGSVTTLAPLQQSDVDHGFRWTWVRAAMQLRRFDEALVAAEALAREAEPLLAFEAGLVAARASRALVGVEPSLARLSDLVAGNDEQQARRDATMALWLADLGRYDVAKMHADAVRARFKGSQVEMSRAFGILANVYARVAPPSQAAAFVTHLIADLGERRMLLEHGHRLLLLKTTLCVDAGRFDDALELADRLDKQAWLRPFVSAVKCYVRMLRGDWDGLNDILLGDVASARLTGPSSELALFARYLHSRASMLLSYPPSQIEATDIEGLVRKQASAFEIYVGLAAIEARVRAGDATSWNEPAAPMNTRTRVACALVEAASLIAEGASAVAVCDEAVKLARNEGLNALLAEALWRGCEAGAATGTLHPPTVVALGETARALGSSQLENEAAFFTACCVAPVVDIATLRTLSRRGAVSPVAARRAAALCQIPTTLDAVDAAVVAGIQRRAGWPRFDLVLTGRPGAEWLFDERTGETFRDATATEPVRLTTVSRRLVEALAAAGGSASKETLTLAIWQVEEYHPLKHDNRLRLAVRTLRRVLRDDQTESESHIMTTDDGYALVGRLTRVHKE